MVRLAPEIRETALKFVRVRLANMRGLDLNTFDFDYDLTWVALLLSPEGQVLGRFGGRDAASASSYLSLSALGRAMEAALAAPRVPLERLPPRFAEDYPAAKPFARSCIHCHHVHEFEREEKRAAGTWQKEQEYRYPPPAAVGLTMDVDAGNRVRHAEGPATASGLKAGDVINAVNNHRVASLLDLQHALDRAEEKLRLSVRRGKEEHLLVVDAGRRWKEKTDISWRWSLKALRPDPPVSGSDLSDAEKKALGLPAARLAFRQGPFLSKEARQAGIQPGDVILGVGEEELFLGARQFEAHFRLYFKSGDEVAVQILRSKEKLRILLKVP